MVFGQALLDIVATWLMAGGLILLIYLALSVADFRDVFFETACLAVHATWLIPAVLLISKGSPLFVTAGLLLIANSIRLLFSGYIPHKGVVRRRGSRLRELQPWGILGAVVFQFGLAALAWGHLFLAAGLIACTALIWTLASVATGLLPRRKKSTLWRSGFSVASTLILTTLLLVWQFRSAAKANVGPGLVNVAKLNAKEAEQKRQDSRKVTRVFAGAGNATKTVPDGVPGVVLHPDPKPEKALAIVTPSITRHFSVTRPVTFPFTGEYHLFPASLTEVPGDSIHLRGTPLETRYKTSNEQPVETEAYQVLKPQFDFVNCGAIRVFILNAEPTPGMLNVQLLAGGTWVDLGSSLFGFDLKQPAGEEMLSFDVPLQVPRSLLASAIRIQFHRDPSQSKSTAKAAVSRFELLPRSYSR